MQGMSCFPKSAYIYPSLLHQHLKRDLNNTEEQLGELMSLRRKEQVLLYIGYIGSTEVS